MLNAAFQVVVSILTVAAALAMIALVVNWITRQRRPALEHACWVIVLLRLVTPPVVPLAIPGYPEWNVATFAGSRDLAIVDRQDHGQTPASPANRSAYDSAQRYPESVSENRRPLEMEPSAASANQV